MQLHVRVIEALDIAKMDVGKSDPYCILSLTSGNDTRRTRVIDNTVTPKWNEDFHFNCPNPAMSALKILMKDKDVMSDDSMATLEVQLCSLQPGVVTDQWYNMTPCKGVKKGGRIHLILHIAPNGAQAFVNAPVGAPGMMPQAGYPQPYSQPGMMPPQGYPQGMPQQGYPQAGFPPRPPGMSDKDYKKMCKKQMKAMKKGHY